MNSKTNFSAMRKCAFMLLLPLIIVSLTACTEQTDVVESGTYTGTVDKVVPEEREIYVEIEGGKRLELYFTETTTLTQNGMTVPFDSLQEGRQVEVQVKKVGQRLDPVSVKILK